MDWANSIQRAIDYMEEHMTEKIDYAEVAKQASSSVFHFQRVFSVLCGMTLGDYVRMRRLSLAANDLVAQNDKVIDIAFRYGYETPESFTRAFTNFHGITPTEAKRGGSVKSFSRLSVKLVLTGGNIMDYRIEKMEAFKVIGKRRRVEKPTSPAPTEGITSFWQELGQDGSMEKIISYFPGNTRLNGLLGICFSCEEANEHFPYGIGVEYDGRPVQDDLEIFEIPAHTFAVFTSKGKLPDAFAETYSRIVTEFFPQNSQYEYANGIELEVYPSDDVANPNYTCEIWVAVKTK